MSLLHKAVEVTEKIEGMSGAAEALQKFIDADNTPGVRIVVASSDRVT